jgi:dihydrofolate synthase/folylpolyglutamate synthase
MAATIADGGRAIANALADLEERCRARSCSWSACSRPRIARAFLKNFAGLARRIVAVPIPIRRKSFRRRDRRSRARVGIPGAERDDVEAALAAIGRFELEPPPRILITGSLYLAGPSSTPTAPRPV